MNARNRSALGVTNEQELNTLRFDVDLLVAHEEERHENRKREDELRAALRQSDDVWRERTSKRLDAMVDDITGLRAQINDLPDRINGQMKDAVEAQAAVIAQAAAHAAEAVAVAAKIAARERDEAIGSEAVKRVLARSTKIIITVLTIVACIIIAATMFTRSRPGDDSVQVMCATVAAAVGVLSFVWYRGRTNH